MHLSTTDLSKRDKNSAYTFIIRLHLMMIFVFSCFVMIIDGSSVYNTTRDLVGTGGVIHIPGEFHTDMGNPGVVSFGAKPPQVEFSGAHLVIPEIGQQVLTGSFWIETIGWVGMQDIRFYLTNTGAGIWSLSGYAWSESAGWLDFSRVTYRLSNTSFSGFVWNDMIGWVDMDGASLDMTSLGGIGKVKLLGSYGSNRIFNTTYNLDGKIAPATITNIINTVRKNIALLTRNIPPNRINTRIISGVFDHSDASGLPNSLDNKLFFINTGATNTRVDYTRSIQERFVNIGNAFTPIHSAIVIGGDIYIDDSIVPEDDKKPRVLIAIKNEKGVGGNIIIDGGITKIKASLVAEGSIYSGEYNTTTGIQRIYNDNPQNLFKIPNRQLYVHGSMISNNTIGGYGVSNGIANTCPYNISPCTDSNALLYDINHFRDFQKDLPEGQLAVLRGYTNNTYDDFSLVIEYDARILDTPPPGLENMQQ